MLTEERIEHFELNFPHQYIVQYRARYKVSLRKPVIERSKDYQEAARRENELQRQFTTSTTAERRADRKEREQAEREAAVGTSSGGTARMQTGGRRVAKAVAKQRPLTQFGHTITASGYAAAAVAGRKVQLIASSSTSQRTVPKATGQLLSRTSTHCICSCFRDCVIYIRAILRHCAETRACHSCASD
jgi:hypothetical protein